MNTEIQSLLVHAVQHAEYSEEARKIFLCKKTSHLIFYNYPFYCNTHWSHRLCLSELCSS